jgi:hypothetical protein
MNILIAALALAGLVAAPAFTRSATAAPENEVIARGKSVGTDPDANVRLQLRRDAGSEGF